MNKIPEDRQGRNCQGRRKILKKTSGKTPKIDQPQGEFNRGLHLNRRR